MSLDSIQVLSALEAIRKRPTMYVGPLEDAGLPNHLIQEGLCIFIDQALDTPGGKIWVTMWEDGMARIESTIPWPVDLVRGVSKAEIFLTTLFACRDAKLPARKELCNHGVVTLNALSSRLTLRINIPDGDYSMMFDEGQIVVPFHRLGNNGGVVGTELDFVLDPKILPHREFEVEPLSLWLKATVPCLDVQVEKTEIGFGYLQ